MTPYLYSQGFSLSQSTSLIPPFIITTIQSFTHDPCLHSRKSKYQHHRLVQGQSNIYNSDVRTKPQLVDIQEVRQRTRSRSLLNECISSISKSFS